MPRKSDSLPINNTKLDKRVKLTDENKTAIREEYASGLASINGLARKYGVSKRLIQFTLFPERQEKAKKGFAERQKEGRYYDKDKHAAYIKKHRDYKKELYAKGLIGSKDNENKEEFL